MDLARITAKKQFLSALHMGDVARLRELLMQHRELMHMTIGYSPFTGSFIPMTWASRFGNIEAIRVLVEHGATVNARFEQGLTPLSCACLGNHVATARVLLEEYHADVNLADQYGNTPLAVASEKKYEELVQLLLHHGANVHARDLNCDTPLLRTTKWEQNNILSVVRMLVEHGADVNARSNYGRATLLQTIACGGDVCRDLSLYLLEHGADPSIGDHEGNLPLFVATAQSQYELVKALVQHGAPVNARNDLHHYNHQGQLGNRHGGETALHCAVRHQDVRMVETLINDCGADIHACDAAGDTPLWLAIQQHSTTDNLAIFSLLLSLMAPRTENVAPTVPGDNGDSDRHGDDNSWERTTLRKACQVGDLTKIYCLVQRNPSQVRYMLASHIDDPSSSAR